MFLDVFGKYAVNAGKVEQCIKTSYQFFNVEDNKKIARLLKNLILEIKLIVGKLFNQHMRKNEEIQEASYELDEKPQHVDQLELKLEVDSRVKKSQDDEEELLSDDFHPKRSKFHVDIGHPSELLKYETLQEAISEDEIEQMEERDFVAGASYVSQASSFDQRSQVSQQVTF